MSEIDNLERTSNGIGLITTLDITTALIHQKQFVTIDEIVNETFNQYPIDAPNALVNLKQRIRKDLKKLVRIGKIEQQSVWADERKISIQYCYTIKQNKKTNELKPIERHDAHIKTINSTAVNEDRTADKTSTFF